MAGCEHDTAELLRIEECDAWFEYLEATRGSSPARYDEVEVWAWSRLQGRLKGIRARVAKAARAHSPGA